MALFDKNPNEANYINGKKHWSDVIKNSGPGELLIWRQPEEDFNTKSTLIVYPSEEAIFFKGGMVEQLFNEGTYKLSTENYPFISRLRNAFTGGISTFSCVVYFVRKAHSMEILWGTDSPIQLRDPVQGIATSVRAHGSYKIQIADSVKFLLKLLGNNVPFLTQEGINNYFRNEFLQYIKSSIGRAIKTSNEEILGICAEQDILAGNILPILQKPFDDYGIKLINFSIAALDIPENDPNRMTLEKAYADKRIFGILGDNWGQQKSAEILGILANNPGAGGVAAAGAGFGLGAVAGGAFSEMAHQLITPMQPQQPAQPQQPTSSGRFIQKSAVQNMVECPSCKAKNAQGARFCSACGTELTAEKVLCAKCGAEMTAMAKFCSACGTEKK